jgi:integrase
MHNFEWKSGETWMDIDLRRSVLRVEKSKNGEKRSIPLSRTQQEKL